MHELERADESNVRAAASGQRRKLRSFWALAAIGGAAAAAAALFAATGPADAADPASTVHAFERGTADWTIAAYPASVLEENEFVITLARPDGTPIENAGLSVLLEMPGMLCGDYPFRLTETEPGTYVGQGVPLMPGLWKATLRVEPPEGGEAFSFSRTLKAVY